MVIKIGNLKLILIIEMFIFVYNYIYSKKINFFEKIRILFILL